MNYLQIKKRVFQSISARRTTVGASSIAHIQGLGHTRVLAQILGFLYQRQIQAPAFTTDVQSATVGAARLAHL